MGYLEKFKKIAESTNGILAKLDKAETCLAEADAKISDMDDGYQALSDKALSIEAREIKANKRIAELGRALIVASASEAFTALEQSEVIERWIAEGSKIKKKLTSPSKEA